MADLKFVISPNLYFKLSGHTEFLVEKRNWVHYWVRAPISKCQNRQIYVLCFGMYIYFVARSLYCCTYNVASWRAYFFPILWQDDQAHNGLNQFLKEHSFSQDVYERFMESELNFSNWLNGEVSKSVEIWLSKSIFYVKKHPKLSDFFFHWRIWI